MPPWTETADWLESDSGAFLGTGRMPLGTAPWSDREVRARLVARARWTLLAVIGLYGLFAGGVFSASPYGFFPTRAQLVFLAGSLATVAAYSLVLQKGWFGARAFRHADHLLVLLDLVFITVLIHLSGGPSSWFWPAYLIATMEAAFLLPRRRDVWLMGAAGGAMHGLMLAGHYAGALSPVAMPFVPDALGANPLYLGLAWSWAAILNAAVAFIMARLMAVIRWDHRALEVREAQLRQFVDSANDLIVCLTPEGRFLYANPLWVKTMGSGLPDLGTSSFFDLIDLDHRARVLREFGRAMLESRGTAMEADFVTRNGARVSVEGSIAPTLKDGQPRMVWCICRDVTARRRAEEQLFHMAHFDGLTGLPNRASLVEKLDQALEAARRAGQGLAVLYVDLDRFKLINDTLGHAVGDELLCEVARRMQGAIRDADLVSRIGGDEFIVTLRDVGDPKEASSLAGRILRPLARPFQIGGHEIFVTASVGIAIYAGDGTGSESLVKKADIAKYHAKSRGRNNHQLYHPRMDEDAERRLVLSNGLRRGLEGGELRVFYQPKIDVDTGRMTAIEALVRWEHPELGLLPPSEFIPLAEETGLILPLGEWVLREACGQNARWQARGLRPMRVGVNLSGYQLQQAGMAASVRRILEETGLDPQWLELEITETVVMQNPALAVAVLEEIRGLGVQVSIDDFGTGHSSLAQLKRFSVNTLKIDKSFIRDLEHNPTDAAIATAIIAMGASLNLQVVAEGVETEGQLSFLRKHECHGAQGFLFAPAVPPEELAGLLEQEGPEPELVMVT
ncbi:putative bifunctional diguanylate cyclase/phosphodiesterase [Geothrix fermentans]|uniref:putative bifunctional diguanylate cyclase/phosphodiesterase n=1 Tax=Geothrix fermentans TaxID=44676 RepID=UPI0003F9A54B|nr:EAL domain-containing protein [Geothrix fermentans]